MCLCACGVIKLFAIWTCLIIYRKFDDTSKWKHPQPKNVIFGK